jgi:hypothetical protein
MHVVIRSYSGQGVSEVFDLLRQREEDVKTVPSGVPGFGSYAAFRSGGGGVTVTICQDKQGRTSPPACGQWVKGNVTTAVEPPAITEGSSFSTSDNAVSSRQQSALEAQSSLV